MIIQSAELLQFFSMMVIPPLPSLGMGVIILFALTVMGAAWKALNWVWLRPKKLERFLRQQGLNGTSYRFLHGDFKEMHGMLTEAYSKPIGLSDDFVRRVYGYEQQVVDTYGKDCFIWAGTTPRILIMNPDQIKDIFSKIYDFQKPDASNNPLVMLLVRGLFNYEGEKWAMHRKIINPAFNMEKLKLMLPAFYSCCNELVTKWESLLLDKELLELDVWPHLQNLTRDAISRTAFGSSYEEGKRIFELQAEQGGYAVRSAQSVYIPGMRFLPTKTNKRMKMIHKEVESLLRGMISNREKAMKEGESAGDDLLGLLLESNKKETAENNKNMGMSILDVIEECKLFYLAGQETTASLLAWTMFLLSIHPQWQIRAREEVSQVFGGEKKLNFDGLNHLKIMTMILYEVMRLYPPISLLGRQVPKDTKLGNLTIPAGVQLLLPIVLIHHDKELWGDHAKEFNPERFSEGISKATKNRVCYVPFGWGPRICVGQNFALIEAKMTLVMILQRFIFEVSPSYAHAPVSGLALQPQHGLQVILRRY